VKEDEKHCTTVATYLFLRAYMFYASFPAYIFYASFSVKRVNDSDGTAEMSR